MIDAESQTSSGNNLVENCTQTDINMQSLNKNDTVTVATQTDIIGWIKEELDSAAKKSIIQLNDRIGDQLVEEHSETESVNTPTDIEEFGDDLTDREDAFDARYKQIDNQFASGYQYLTNVSDYLV